MPDLFKTQKKIRSRYTFTKVRKESEHRFFQSKIENVVEHNIRMFDLTKKIAESVQQATVKFNGQIKGLVNSKQSIIAKYRQMVKRSKTKRQSSDSSLTALAAVRIQKKRKLQIASSISSASSSSTSSSSFSTSSSNSSSVKKGTIILEYLSKYGNAFSVFR